MKRKPKCIEWVSILTIVITLLQIVVPFCFGKVFFSISFLISLFINVAAMVLINWNINWLNKNKTHEEAEKYKKEAPCTFQVFKFAFGIIISTIIAFICSIGKFESVNISIGQVIVMWYLLPLLLVFWAIASLDAGFYDTRSILKKLKRLPNVVKSFIIMMFVSDDQRSLWENILFKIATIVMILITVCYFIYKIVINLYD